MNKTTHFTKHSGYIGDLINHKRWENQKKDPRMLKKLVGFIIAGFVIAIILVFGTAWIVLRNS